MKTTNYGTTLIMGFANSHKLDRLRCRGWENRFYYQNILNNSAVVDSNLASNTVQIYHSLI